MENIQENVELPEEELMKENLRVQKTVYIKKQMERQRAAEDARLEQLLKEQDIIEDLRESTDDSMWQTEETRKYNREFQEHLNMQVYKAHGITEDKIIGMREYKSALYRGAAVVLFFLSLALTVLCGVLHGFESNVYLLMLAYTAVEGALIGKKQMKVLDVVCKVLYILVFPAMLAMFVCYELAHKAYELSLPFAAILGGFAVMLGIISYFLYDPYRCEKKKMRDAKSQIRDIEKAAGKEIRKNHKIREREEREAQKLLKQEKEGNQKIEETGLQLLKGIRKRAGSFTRLKKQEECPVEVIAVEADSENILQNEKLQEEEAHTYD